MSKSSVKAIKADLESIIKPSLTFEGGDEHVLQTLFKGKPEKNIVLTSVGYVNIPGTNNYVSYTIKSKGAEIISIEVEEPNMRGIAEETSKIAFVSAFCGIEQ